MFDPLDSDTIPLMNRLNHKRFFAGLVLWLEKVSTAALRTIIWLCFISGLWLLQVPSFFGTLGESFVWIISLAGLVYFIFKDWKNLSFPSKEHINRRLEDASALSNRPLTAIEDELANPGSETTDALWESNHQKSISLIKSLKTPKPKPVIAQRDPIALRVFVFLLLFIGFVVADEQATQRLSHGMMPISILKSGQHKKGHIALWITPPKYTGMDQIVIEETGRYTEPFKIPEGSLLKLRVSKGRTKPSLMMGSQTLSMDVLDKGSWGLEKDVTPGDKLIVKQWPKTLIELPYEFITDTPPSLSLAIRESETITGPTSTTTPETLEKGQIRPHLLALDDYGVKTLTMRMTLDPMVEDPPLGHDIEETRTVTSAPGVEADILPVYDLTWHPWSGLPIVLTFSVQDDKGQSNEELVTHMTLPEKTFKHPIAKKIIELRKRLIWTPRSAAGNVGYELSSLLLDPVAFQSDIVVFLSLRSASSRLLYNREEATVVAVISQLWDTALRIEEGDILHAARNMRSARDNLERLLNNPDASDEQIAQAMDDLREAMAEYFRELHKEMQKNMAEGFQIPNMSPEMLKNMVNPNDLAAFLDKLQADALSGDADSAQEMLSKLQEFMDQMSGMQNFKMPPQMEFMSEGINELQELIEKQEILLEQTKQQAKILERSKPQSYPEFMPFNNELFMEWDDDDMPPTPSGQDLQNKKPSKSNVDTQQNKVEQDALRFILGQLMQEADQQLGEIPKNLQLAELDMRNAAKELAENRPDLAVPYQEDALMHLREAMENMSQQMQAMMEKMFVMSFGSPRLDPLGRPMQEGQGNNMFSGEKIEIPDEAQRKRVEEILKTLRRRSGEVSRPDYELDYFRRLMKQF